MSENENNTNNSIASRLKDVHVGPRPDLEVSRHIFRGEVSYILRDPITFQSHSLTHDNYEIFVCINADLSLSEIFNKLVEGSQLDSNREEDFYHFIMSLHQLGFLSLPVSDSKRLYQRYEAKQSAKCREKLMGFLFLRIPLINPDMFLERTMRFARPVFTPWFFLGWLTLMVACGFIIVQRWNDIIEPLNGILAMQNLLFVWATMIGLKVCHEFGHAYACKHFGGHVPEMGAYMIAMTPCAYVDATASWGFTKKSQRLIVSLAGMYIETLIAGCALLLWSVTGPSLLNSFAYQIAFLASVVTVGFNLNPLMRYDGYYIFSDLIEIPNLRQRSTQFVKSIISRVLLGKTVATHFTAPFRTKCILFVFGIAANLYRISIVLAICGLIAYKLFFVGMLLAFGYAGMQIFDIVKKSIRYLWWSPQTQPIRVRAIVVSIIMLVLLPIGLACTPIFPHVGARGVLASESEQCVRVNTPGFVSSISAESGRNATAGDVIAHLDNPDAQLEIAEAQAQVEACMLRLNAYRKSDRKKASQEKQLLDYHQRRTQQRRSEAADLAVRVDHDGLILNCLKEQDIGRYLEKGDPVAMICSGRWIVRVLLTADDLASVKPKVGQMVECRVMSDVSRVIVGSITHIAPSGSRHIDIPSLTHLAGGDIAVRPVTDEAQQPYFEIVITFDIDNIPTLRHGTTTQVQFNANSQTVSMWLYRRFLRFSNRLRTS